MSFRIVGVCCAIVLVSLQVYHELQDIRGRNSWQPQQDIIRGRNLIINEDNTDSYIRAADTTKSSSKPEGVSQETLQQILKKLDDQDNQLQQIRQSVADRRPVEQTPPSPSPPPTLPPSSEEQPNKKRLADGCYNVFLDVGANIGVHTRFLYEPDKYPDSKSAVKHFENQFGKDRDNRDFCSFGIEPNPAHKERHLQLQSAYQQMGWKYHPLFVGVSDTAGNLTFHHMGDAKEEEWGFTSLRTHNAKGKAEIIPIIRMADFLLDEIKDRKLPSTVHGKYPDGPKVVMKFDIEGMEYVTLPDLVTSGAMCQTVDFCFGEFHDQWFFFPQNRTETHEGLYLKNKDQGLEWGNSLIRALKHSKNCKTECTPEDDESYLHDGIPFPEPAAA